MLRGLRFVIFASFLGACLSVYGSSIKLALTLLSQANYFAPHAPCVWCMVGLSVLGTAYSIWLAGATLSGWRMPLVVHLGVIALLFLVMLWGPRDGREPDLGGPPAERALQAMRTLAHNTRDSGRDAGPCAAGGAGTGPRQLTPGRVPTGYRSYGREVPFRVQVLRGRDGPIKSLPEDGEVGTLYLACGERGDFWITAVVTAAVPTGRAALLRDGVGKVVVIAGETL